MLAADVVTPRDLQLRVQAGDDGNGVILQCKGQITVGETSRALQSAVAQLLPRYAKVIVDLSGIHNLDRRGLEVLVSLYPSARLAGSTLKYVNLTTPLSDARSAKPRSHKLAS